MNNLALFRSKTVLADKLRVTVEKNSFAIDWDLKVAFFVCSRKLYSLNLHTDEVKLDDSFVDKNDFCFQ